ncbi:MAG TPA: mobile mystery protein B, partial [Gammaproteobacteria bacterium]
ATERARRRKFVLNEPSLNKLHGEMFGDVWEWAGTFRTTNKNIGIPYHQIATNLRVLLDDCKYWIDHNTYPLDEIAARFHHRLVAIHPYPNGNGRHARLATELFLKSLRRPPFTWGSETGTDDAATRQRYIAALQAADANNYEPLLAFVRS